MSVQKTSKKGVIDDDSNSEDESAQYKYFTPVQKTRKTEVKKQALKLSAEETVQVEEMFAKYMAQSSTQKREMVTFRNLYPNQKQKAIKQRGELGFISFERAKQT